MFDPTYEPQQGVPLFAVPWFGSDEPEASLLEEMDWRGWTEFSGIQTAIFQLRRLKIGDFNIWESSLRTCSLTRSVIAETPPRLKEI